jgi:hypothetical protein
MGTAVELPEGMGKTRVLPRSLRPLYGCGRRSAPSLPIAPFFVASAACFLSANLHYTQPGKSAVFPSDTSPDVLF